MRYTRTSTLALVALALVTVPVATAPGTVPGPQDALAPTRDTYLKLAAETDQALRRDVLGVWFPRTVDTVNGGFLCNFERDWKPGASDGKFSVFQGRMTWVAAQVVFRVPDLKDQYLPVVQHGMKYLNDVLWDKEKGGFFWGLDDKGQISPRFTDNKHLYGMSFGMYGAAAAYKATRDPKALDLAQRAFRWMDEHAHDAKNGGYHEWLTRDGKVIQDQPATVRVREVAVAGFPVGYKSMNTHIHLLESFAELYDVWKDETLRQRLAELLSIVRDRVCVEPGAMGLYFTPDWRAVPGPDSFGHDVETAYLMLEAEEILGRGHDPRTERMARMLVDHALAYGWDETYGGIYTEGTAYSGRESRKDWWEQVESLNVLLLMHEMYGKETDVYFKAFLKQWAFIRDHQIDSEFRGLYAAVERDGTVTNYGKAQMWKAAYHDGRALMNVTERLRRLARR